MKGKESKNQGPESQNASLVLDGTRRAQKTQKLDNPETHQSERSTDTDLREFTAKERSSGSKQKSLSVKNVIESEGPGRGLLNIETEPVSETAKVRRTPEETSQEISAHETPKSQVIEKPPPTMNVSVHRLRHLNYRPKPILCLAATPFDPKASDYVALSRDNGSVELHSPDEKWRAVATVPGLLSRTVDVMAWVCGFCDDSTEDESATSTTSVNYSSTFHESHSRTQRHRTLVGASRDGTLFVVDFARTSHAAVTGSGGGGIFSLASLCEKTFCSRVCSRLVAAGCEDGSIRVYRIDKDNDRVALELVSTVPCAGSAILSLAWRRPTTEPSGRGIGGTVLFAGVADGTIRRFDCVSTLAKARQSGTIAHAFSTGTVLLEEETNENYTWKSTLRMTVETYGRSTPTRIWSLELLGDMTVVSGDSLGHVQFWDGNIGTLLQTFEQNDLKADVLALAVSINECRVFASGVDSRVVCIERPPGTTESTTPSSGKEWIMTYAQRPHTHDVKALAVCRLQDKSGTLKPRENPNEILCSGGVDTKLCTYLMKDFRKVRPKNWYPWPTISPVDVAAKARVLIMMREDRVEFVSLAESNSESSFPVLVPEEDTLIGTLEIKGNSNLVCSAVSDDGEFLAISDASSLLLFRVEYSDRRAVPSKVEIPSDLQLPCASLRFAPDNRLFCARMNRSLDILNVSADVDSANVALQHTFAMSALGSGAVQVYSVSEGACRHWWSLPPLEGPNSTIHFLGETTTQLAVACTNFAFYIFDVQERKLSDWSEKAGFPMFPNLPSELKSRSDYPVRFACNPATPHSFLMGSFGAFTLVNTDQPLPTTCRIFPEKHVRGKRKRKKSEDQGQLMNTTNCTVCLRYNSMLYMDFIAKNELVVVEQPWLNVVATFPEALERRIYGS